MSLLFAKKIIFKYFVFYDSLINAYKHLYYPDNHCATESHARMRSARWSLRMAKVRLVKSLEAAEVWKQMWQFSSGCQQRSCRETMLQLHFTNDTLPDNVSTDFQNLNKLSEQVGMQYAASGTWELWYLWMSYEYLWSDFLYILIRCK